jgi:hypothetical protein
MATSPTIDSRVHAAHFIRETMAGAHFAYGLVVRMKRGNSSLFESEGAAHVGDICGMFLAEARVAVTSQPLAQPGPMSPSIRPALPSMSIKPTRDVCRSQPSSAQMYSRRFPRRMSGLLLTSCTAIPSAPMSVGPTGHPPVMGSSTASRMTSARRAHTASSRTTFNTTFKDQSKFGYPHLRRLSVHTQRR